MDNGMLRAATRRGFTIVELLVILTIIAILASLISARITRAREKSAFTACAQNLRNIATALQAYANENDQVYPPALSALAPMYIGAVPLCPNAKEVDTYSPSYEKSEDPRNFTIYCQGTNHTEVFGVEHDSPYFIFSYGLGPQI